MDAQDVTIADLEEAITNLAATAARLPHKVGPGRWQHLHAQIDALLVERDNRIAGLILGD